MKKIFIFLGLMFVMLSSTYAQKGRQAIGFGLSYGTEIESAGLGIKYQYNITNPLRIEPLSGSSKCQTLSAVWSDHVQLDV